MNLNQESKNKFFINSSVPLPAKSSFSLDKISPGCRSGSFISIIIFLHLLRYSSVSECFAARFLSVLIFRDLSDFNVNLSSQIDLGIFFFKNPVSFNFGFRIPSLNFYFLSFCFSAWWNYRDEINKRDKGPKKEKKTEWEIKKKKR